MGSNSPNQAKKLASMERQSESAWTALKEADFATAEKRFKKRFWLHRSWTSPVTKPSSSPIWDWRRRVRVNSTRRVCQFNAPSI